jgi:hypothetical protein
MPILPGDSGTSCSLFLVSVLKIRIDATAADVAPAAVISAAVAAVSEFLAGDFALEDIAFTVQRDD